MSALSSHEAGSTAKLRTARERVQAQPIINNSINYLGEQGEFPNNNSYVDLTTDLLGGKVIKKKTPSPPPAKFTADEQAKLDKAMVDFLETGDTFCERYAWYDLDKVLNWDDYLIEHYPRFTQAMKEHMMFFIFQRKDQYAKLLREERRRNETLIATPDQEMSHMRINRDQYNNLISRAAASKPGGPIVSEQVVAPVAQPIVSEQVVAPVVSEPIVSEQVVAPVAQPIVSEHVVEDVIEPVVSEPVAAPTLIRHTRMSLAAVTGMKKSFDKFLLTDEQMRVLDIYTREIAHEFEANLRPIEGSALYEGVTPSMLLRTNWREKYAKDMNLPTEMVDYMCFFICCYYEQLSINVKVEPVHLSQPSVFSIRKTQGATRRVTLLREESLVLEQYMVMFAEYLESTLREKGFTDFSRKVDCPQLLSNDWRESYGKTVLTTPAVDIMCYFMQVYYSALAHCKGPVTFARTNIKTVGKKEKGLSLKVVKPLPKYDPKEQYYWHDYVLKYHNAWYEFKQPKEILEEMAQDLSKCARVLISSSNKTTVFFKEDPLQLFLPRDLPATKPPTKHVVHYKDSEGKWKDLSIYEPLYKDKRLWVNQVVCEPYHSDIGYKRENVLNTFPGFAAKLVPLTDEVKARIQYILHHIYVVWANSNEDHYWYLLRWLSYPITHLTRTNKILILKGKQGCGKTIIFEFLRDYVYSPKSATIVKSVQDVLCRFNSILMGKLLILIDESASVSDGSMTKKEKNDFKALITGNTIHIENKGKDILEFTNNITFAMGTNNDNCADLDEGSRRECILECDSRYAGNTEYFNNLCSTFNQDTGDALYTYFRWLGTQKLPSIEQVPFTQIKADMIEAHKNKARTFLDSFFAGEVAAPIELFYEDESPVGLCKPLEEYPAFVDKPFYKYIRTKEFYTDVYKPWHTEFSSGRPWSERAFSDELYRYDPGHLMRARKRTRCFTGPITYIGDKFHSTITVREPFCPLNGGGDLHPLVPTSTDSSDNEPIQLN